MTEQYVDFVHLHNHSDYSLYDGFMTIENMVKRAKELKFKAIALTDHGRVGGFIKLHNMAKKYGVKGIYGLEAYIVHDLSDPKGKRYHQTILAKSEIGYKNILKLSTIGNQNAKRGFPRLTFELLKQHHEGLIIASGCSAGEFAALAIDRRDNDAFALAERYKEVWGSDYYLEVMYTKYEPQLTVLKKAIECAKYTGIKIIATNDCHYSLESDAKYHDLKISISRSAPLKEEDKTPPEYFLKSYDEMKRIFTKTEMLHNTMEIEEKCDFDITLGTGKLPEFKVPTDNNDFNEFKKNLVGRNDEEAFLSYLAEKGLKENGLHENTVYVERLRTELETIRFTGFARYFLIVWDYIDYARNVNKQRIGAGRGCFLPENNVKTNLGKKKIININAGDMVLSHDGEHHEVKQKHEYEIEEEIIAIEMVDGRTIECTSDHLILVEREGHRVWVAAKNLSENDDIVDLIK